MPDETLVYLYGIVAAGAPDPPASLSGIGGGSVRLVRAGDLAAIASDVQAKEYSEGALAAGLTDVGWAGARAAEHERVLTWFVDRTTVVPSSPFSLHESEDRLVQRLAGQAPAMLDALRRLAGHEELGVRVWRLEEPFAARVLELSPALRELEDERRAATPGRRYLLGKRIDELRGDETERVTTSIVRQAYDELAGVAARAKALPIPTRDRGPRTRTLVLDAVFLVEASSGDAFRRLVHRHVAAQGASGLEWEFTGPWPPYHFVSDS